MYWILCFNIGKQQKKINFEKASCCIVHNKSRSCCVLMNQNDLQKNVPFFYGWQYKTCLKTT